MFLFLQMFLLLIAFVHFTVSLLFLRCFVFVLLPWVLRIWKSVFYSQAFFTLHSFLLLSRHSWGQQSYLKGDRTSYWGLKHRPNSSVCLNPTVFSNYMISSKLYLNFSKYGDKLLVGKSLINFKHCHLIDCF